MGYVGNQTTTAFTSMDKQDITGDGTPNYTLSHAVANSNEIEVFVNNVRQEPSVAYSASGTTLTMTGNVASTDDFYVVYQGKAVGTISPPDGSVSTAKIADDAVTSAKLDAILSALVLPAAYGAGSGGTEATYTANGKNYKSHTFLANGTFTVTTAGFFDIMMVAGGGAGSGWHGGGGGAGNVVIINDTITAGAYSLVVGSGGNGIGAQRGENGSDTTGFGESAFGGGGGGAYNIVAGGSGGCGGAGSALSNGAYTQGGAGCSGKLGTREGFRYGNAAGNGWYINHQGAGGGGAGEKGEEGSSTAKAGNGGDGIPNAFRTGSDVYYGGGGGGGSWAGGGGSSANVGLGGAGGGGNGNYNNASTMTAGAANTGGGGGGFGGNNSQAGGAGGTGIIVIRYEV
jgi:hypothetical protein